jgi:hypothetical protein
MAAMTKRMMTTRIRIIERIVSFPRAFLTERRQPYPVALTERVGVDECASTG